MRILVNTSNLHVGGGVQVAVSFICELSLREEAVDISLLLSSEVYKNLAEAGCDLSCFRTWRVFDVHGFSAIWSKLSDELKGYDIVFTVFGPLYVLRQRFVSVVGFAQAWVAYPENEFALRLGFSRRFALRLKYRIQAFFYGRADFIVVEADHVRERLCKFGIADPEKIAVVPNCVSSVFLTPDSWSQVCVRRSPERIAIGFVGRDYPHKNLDIIPEIKNSLAETYGLDVDFFVTLNDVEWAARSEKFRDSVINVGPLTVMQCPSFYAAMDGVLFPSLLECFSVTPLEALVMQRPLFASDRAFVSDVCGGHAFFFDPLSSESAALTIHNYYRCYRGNDADRLLRAREHAINFSSAASRADSYLRILMSHEKVLERHL